MRGNKAKEILAALLAAALLAGGTSCAIQAGAYHLATQGGARTLLAEQVPPPQVAVEQPAQLMGTDGAQPARIWEHWYDVPVFAHAMGSVDGRTETNSLDAFLASYRAGHRVFEVDLQLTSDRALVARHDWEQISYYNLEQQYVSVMDHETFMKTPIRFFYTPLDIDDLVAMLKTYPDIWLVTDSKETDENTVRVQMQRIAQAVARAEDPSLWKRIIVQVYSEEMYNWISESFPVSNWIYTLYQQENPDYERVGAFCQGHGVKIVTMIPERMKAENVRILHKYGCKVYIHTVNRLRAMLELSWGADGFYSDFIAPQEYESVLRGTNEMTLGQAAKPWLSAGN